MQCNNNQLPEIICRRTSVGPVIDGKLDDEAWNGAEVIESFWRLGAEDNLPLVRPKFATKVRCLWDSENLYVAFECKSPDVWATKTRRDDSLWDEPVAEIFLDVDGGGKSFFEFQTNPLGAIYDSFTPDVALNDEWRRWSKWDCERLCVGVSVDGKLNERSHRDNGWSAEFAIPFAELADKVGRQPCAGDVWRANFCRYDYSAELAKPELSCWSPVEKAFSDLPRFGLLKFKD